MDEHDEALQRLVALAGASREAHQLADKVRSETHANVTTLIDETHRRNFDIMQHETARDAFIGFSITEATNPFESIIFRLCRLGAVHQKVTQDAMPDGVETAHNILLGVLYNDSPLPDAGDLATFKKCIENIPSGYAPYLTKPWARWQVRKGINYGLVARYKSIPQWILRVCGVSAADCKTGAAMLDYRARPDKTRNHFMRESEDEKMGETIRKVLDTVHEWYTAALLQDDEEVAAFYFGHILHTAEDACSEAHTKRDKDGRLQEIYFFGDQKEYWHSAHEGYKAITTENTEAWKRFHFCVPRVNKLIVMFNAHRERKDHVPELVDEFVEAFRRLFCV
jgi:hypothetical protein